MGVIYKSEHMTYKIIRFYKNEKVSPRVMKTVATLREAKAHCSLERTKKEGKWFEGYQKV
jgi:hypothetical protein